MIKLHKSINKDKNNNINYEYSVFHPKMYEDNVYIVRRHVKGEKWIDKNLGQTEIVAKNERDALNKAKKENKWY